MNISVDQLGQKLVSRGFKLTAPRRAVLHVVADMHESLSPAEIYERGQRRYPRLGLVTVYRTLSLLVELGYLQRLHLDGGCHSYAVIAQPNSHHLHCSMCGRVEAFPCGEIEPLIAALQVQTGYEIDVHMLELMGRCPACQDKASSEEG
ncbi:MAG: transcriptional repressor [Thermoflexales bacterium]|nr:transcriptional repressor [Thermoflexales bacterium]